MRQTTILPDALLRHGLWQKVLRNGHASILLSDPSYSERTHKGQRSGSNKSNQSKIGYEHLTSKRAAAFVQSWAPRINRWVLLWCDHVAFQWWEKHWAAAGFRTFPPVPWIKDDGGSRIHEAGPAPGVEYLFVARAPGWRSKAVGMNKHRCYHVNVDREFRPAGFMGVKRVGDINQVLADYATTDDVIIDPFAGIGSVGVATIQRGIAYVGAECDEHTFNFALRRLRSTTIPLILPDEGESTKQADIEKLAT